MDDKRYTLMNKNRPVLDFLYNLDTHHVVKILKRRELGFAPPAILDMKGNPTRAALDVWWLRRAIPASRAQIQRLIAELHVDSTLALAEKTSGFPSPTATGLTTRRIRRTGMISTSSTTTSRKTSGF